MNIYTYGYVMIHGNFLGSVFRYVRPEIAPVQTQFSNEFNFEFN